jgi:hypothetical protein
MAKQATATFAVQSWDENEILEADGGSKVT